MKARSTHPLCEFVQNGRDATEFRLPLQLDHNNWVAPCAHGIDLGHDASWCLENHHPRLFARSVYFKVLDQIVTSNESLHTIVVGSPGSGKTLLLSFLIYQLRHALPRGVLDEAKTCAPPCVVVDWNPLALGGGFFMIDSTGQVFEGIRGTSFTKEMSLASTVYLCETKRLVDGQVMEPLTRSCAARMVVLCEPDLLPEMCNRIQIPTSSNVYAEQVESVQIQVLPPWQWHELKQCRDFCYPELHNDTLESLFELWGGNARQIFNGKDEEAHQTLFEKSLQYVNYPDLTRAMEQGLPAFLAEKDPRKRMWLQQLVQLNEEQDGAVGWVFCSVYAINRFKMEWNLQQNRQKLPKKRILLTYKKRL